MSSSDDEDEKLTPSVSDYSFADDNDKPISFSELRMLWDEADSLGGNVEKIGLYGTTDKGLQKIFEQVIAWKFDLSFVKPEIFVLSQKKKWFMLLKPRKSFEEKIRTILITVHFLHYVKRNPDATGKVLWEYLAKFFSLYEPRPSENDLAGHLNLISEAVKRDEILTKSQVLIKFLQAKPKKMKVFDEETGSKSISGFIVDDDVNEGEGSDYEEEDIYDHVCAICDNGGDILPCEGKCLRSFHASVESGAESGCDSLGLSDEQVKAIGTFECKNCQYKQHQCYCCGKLGSSDKLAGAQVFQCVNGTCGYFYHPNCVTAALSFKYGDEPNVSEAEIAAGKAFMCPLHFCYVCKEIEPENATDLQMQFAVCRRCPRAYHRKCLPRKIVFEDDDNNIAVRAWEGLMVNKILIYCLKHEIDDELETPSRNHILFPYTDQKKRKHILESVPVVRTSVKNIPHSPVGSKKTSVAKLFKGDEKLSASNKRDGVSSREGKSLVLDSSRKPKLANKSKMALKKKLSGTEQQDGAADDSSSIGAKLFEYMKTSKSNKLEKREDFVSKEQTTRDKLVVWEKDDSVILNDDSKKRIDSIIRETEGLISLDDVKSKHTAPSTHVYSAKNAPQNITLGKVEVLIEAIHAALSKLERGGSLEDAKALCRPGLLTELGRWKNKLKVYLAPFLYGIRYTSFGRHFTNVDKLQAIADKLHWYVNEGDTVLDFCCGANDFSCLVRKKLDEVGKSCSYKNYDILQAKNDFNFEKRDWMTVSPRDLPDGKRLIIGLNPPFGVNASLANKFIDKALEFKPKLLILIVPPETERLDKKKQPYDLVWEDQNLLSGKAFYLPGSIDVGDKRLEDWNLTAPPLSLWSRSDWTAKHRAIALKNGHLPGTNQSRYKKDAADSGPQARVQSSILAGGVDAIQGTSMTNAGVKIFQPCGGVKESQNNNGHALEKENITLEKGNDGDRKRRRGSDEIPSDERSVPRRLSPNKSGDRPAKSSLAKTPAAQSDVRAEGHHDERSVKRRLSPNKSGDRPENTSLAKTPAVQSRNDVCAEGHHDERSVPRRLSPNKSGDRPANSSLANTPAAQSRNDVIAEGHHDERSVPRRLSPNKSGDRPANSSLAKTPTAQSRNGVLAEGHHDEKYVPRRLSPNKSGDRPANSSLAKTPAAQSRNDVLVEGHHKKHGNGKHGKETTGGRKRGRGSGKSSEERRSLPRHSSPNQYGGRLASSHMPEPPRMHSRNEVQAEDYQHIDHDTRSGSQPLSHKGYNSYEGVGNGRRNNYSDEQFMEYQMEDQKYRSYDSYMGHPNEVYRMEADFTQSSLFGRHGPEPFIHRDYGSATPAFPSYSRPTVDSSYGHLRPAIDPGYSTMQRYAPRLDESNLPTVDSSYGHLRPAVDSGYPSTLQRYAPKLDELNNRRISNGVPPDLYNSTVRAGLPNDSRGFAPVPNHLYSRPSSSGWLND